MKKLTWMTICILLIALFPLQQTNAAVLNPNKMNTYEQLSKDVKLLSQKYPSIISVRSIGKTPYGRTIWAVKLGKGDATLLINAAHHAREWPTTNLTMKMIEQYANAYMKNTNISGYSVRNVLNQTSIWFVPMVNPDGVTLQQKGVNAFPQKVRKSLIAMNDGSTNFKRWKANAQGIDLNRQYPGGWYKSSIKHSWYMNYSGTRPLQAPEAKAMYDFTMWVNPETEVSYHSSGHILYWGYKQTGSQYKRDLSIANKLHNITGYKIVKPTPNQKGGGFTDWFTYTLKKPGFTPEISSIVNNSNPPLSIMGDEWNRNKKVGLYLASLSSSYWEKRLTQVKKVITTFSEKRIYNRPEKEQATNQTLPAGTYQVNATKSGWYRISNPKLGPIWIDGKHVLNGAPKNIDETVLINQDTTVKDEPTTNSHATAIGVQVIKAVQTWGSYIGIRTQSGLKWISSKNVTRNYNPTSTQITLTVDENVDTYSYPTTRAEKVGSIQAGTTVKSIAIWNGWIQIKTGHTTGWIKWDEK
ncbi:M14 family zinc carboxypeptidase [Heyndrickxia sp. NPDC080065]|uniref:M14 family zinc carboxypeptidase n=1 Tax=Heyndrickxia sp. NPDC080065 TaxID=3390568 RepID=UPI003CFFB50B